MVLAVGLRDPNLLYFVLPPLLAGLTAYANAEGPTSYPLPQMIVNTSTEASTTATKTVFIKGSGEHFTPTVTEYVALCTPYCAGTDSEGRCMEVQGCKNVVRSGAAKFDKRSFWSGVMFVATPMLAMAAGRIVKGLY
jgi:hypothetical protein